MKKSMFFAIISGLLVGVILHAINITILEWEWYIIAVPMCVILNILYGICKD